jgi:hypothetical protein
MQESFDLAHVQAPHFAGRRAVLYIPGGVAQLMHQTRSALRENRNGAVNKGDGFRIFHFGALRARARKSAAPLVC